MTDLTLYDYVTKALRYQALKYGHANNETVDELIVIQLNGMSHYELLMTISNAMEDMQEGKRELTL